MAKMRYRNWVEGNDGLGIMVGGMGVRETEKKETTKNCVLN